MLLWNNLRYAARQLTKNRILSFAIITTLALCIGANTAIFTIVHTLFFQSPPYPHPDQLVLLTTTQSNQSASDIDTAQDGTQWELIRDHASLLTAAVYGTVGGVNLSTSDHVEFIQSQRVSAGFFGVLGTGLAAGREFTREEDIPNGPPLVIISYKLWQRVFHGDAAITGHTITLKGTPYIVTGVAPRDFRTLPGEVGVEVAAAPDVWVPLHPTRDGEGSGDNYGIVARLNPGVSLAQADSQLNAVLRDRFLSLHLPKGVSFTEHAMPLEAGITNDLRSGVQLMWGAVLLVLLIGCVNIAGLLLAESANRNRELATRLALGATRGRLAGELFTESVLLAFIGGLLGLSLAEFALDELVKLNPAEFSLNGPIHLDLNIAAITLAASLATSILFGLFPAFETSAIDLRSALAEGGRSTAGSRRQWKRQWLVFAEVALGVVLVSAAGLLIRSFTVLANAGPGFDPNHLTIASASLQDARYATSAAGSRLFHDSLQRIRQIPGVESAAVALTSPYGRPLNEGVSQINGQPVRNGATEFTYATPELFDTLRMRVLRGHTFSETDTAQSPRVAVINQVFLHRFLPNTADPTGSVIKIENKDWQIIGLVNSVQERNGIGEGGPVDYFPEVYVPVAQFPDGLFSMANTWFSPVWMVRSQSLNTALPQTLQQALFSVDPKLPFSSFKTMAQVRGTSMQSQFYHATIFSILAALAILLAAIGLYGLIAASVQQRKHEMGIRLALGASLLSVMRTTMAPGLALSVAGVAVGTLLALSATRLLKGLIWGVALTDPATFITVAAFLLLVAAIASIIPALRLAKLDPAQTLRDE